MQESIFTKIANKEIPSNIVLENDKFISILDIKPLVKGMTVVFPKENLGNHVYDLNLKDYLLMLQFTREVANILQRKLDVDKIITIIEGFEIDHVHIKLLPSNKEITSEIKPLDVGPDYFDNLLKQLKR